MKRMPRILLTLVLLLGSVVALGAVRATPSKAAGSVTFSSLLTQMGQRDSVAEYPGYSTGEASSTSHASFSTDWYNNNDFDQYIRQENDGHGTTENVMLDINGPGVITRIWEGGHNHYGHIRFYEDGASTPAIDAVYNDLLRGNTYVKSPFVFETGPDLTKSSGAGAAGGLEMMMPIPFSSHMKITYDGSASEGNYYVIEYRQYHDGSTVTSYSSSDYTNASNSGQIASLTNTLSRIQQVGTSGTQAYDNKSDTEQWVNRYVGNGGGQTQWSFGSGSPGAIRNFEIQMSTTNDDTLAHVWLTMSFDGEQTVYAPIGDFFGSGAGFNPGTTEYNSVGSDGTLSSRFIMPFQRNGVVTVTNNSGTPINISLWSHVGGYSWTGSSMYLHAYFNDTGNFLSTRQDRRHVFIRGQGMYVADTLSDHNANAANNEDNWWGEGDEKIYVDGEVWPSHWGTGTEDYFGYSWNHTYLFQSPWYSQRRVPNSDPNGANAPDYTGYNGFTVLNRNRILDTIPFNQSLRFDWENWNWDPNNAYSDYTYTSYFYGKPGTYVYTEPDPTYSANNVINSGWTYLLQSKVSGWNLDVTNGSTSDGAGMQDYLPNDGGAQQYRLDYLGTGKYGHPMYTLTNIGANKVVEDPGFSTADAQQLDLWDSNGGANQKWELIPEADDYYELQNEASGDVMDLYQAATTPGDRVNQYPQNNSDAQMWRINPLG